MNIKRQAYLPAAVVALVAVVLQSSVLMTRSENAPHSRLDALRTGYGTTIGFAIRSLDPGFIGRRLGHAFTTLFYEPRRPERRHFAAGATPQPTPESSPEATPSPSPTPTPKPGLIRATSGITLAMTVDRASPRVNDIVTYTIMATNTGDGSVTTVYTISTHAPRFTFLCPESGTGPCATPGTYDGSSSSSSDAHVAPAASERTAMLGPHKSMVLRRVRVQVAPAAPSGTKLYNHAHVDIVGDNMGAKTIFAPTAVVK